VPFSFTVEGGEEIGQTGDAAFLSAGAEGHEHFGFGAHQLGHMLVFGIPDGAVEQTQGDFPVGHRLDVFIFVIQGYRPEHDVEEIRNGQDMFLDVNDCDFAAAAGGSPV
jgi:hypothetical protein